MAHKLLVSLFTLLITHGVINAESMTQNDNLALAIADIEIVEVAPSKEALNMQGSYIINKSLGIRDIADIVGIADKIVAVGTKVWKLIKDEKPNVEIALAKPISVLPYEKPDSGTLAFFEMEEWSAPYVKTYTVEAKNYLGGTLASFDYNVIYQAKGKKDGVGQYITGLQMRASSVYVKWGVSFDATSELMSIANVGTSEEPVASAMLQLNYTFATVLSQLTKSETFYVLGTGELTRF